ncbi:20589_t:CDS:2 [Funneliformis geosporum]|uniref:8576_t:CDS:1 n=1 Tax=Funneliformis geosporum TaxID=1117311 RepID=A0A9W4SWJ5_9GLOM|nr:8576_t:CDS:2 [Funneliformis geosporum]CAI2188571.1 20589_t:CDS:2 [Funneliformis geosporum]
MDYQRQLLEELMAPFETSNKHNFWDDAVCKHFLVKFCPNSLFTNTKSDLGPCTKLHDEKLRKQYQEALDREKYDYEIKFYDYLQSLCNDLDKKIRKGNDRLNVRPDDTLLNPNKDEKEEKMIILDEKIKDLLVKIEEAGEEGRVQEAQILTKDVESLQKDLDFLKNSDDSNPLFKQERRMLVCEVCGAFLVTNDTSNRMDAHLQGKQHTGYKQIRETLHEWKQLRAFTSRDVQPLRGDFRRDPHGRHEPYPRNNRREKHKDRRDEKDQDRDHEDYGRRRNSKEYRRDRIDKGRRYYDD